MATAPVPNSSTGGFLLPAAPAPPYGETLEDLISATIKGILGWTTDQANNYIRPRWQPEPPPQPDFTVDWVAFGISGTKKDWMPYASHDPNAYEDGGATTTEQDEELTLLISFYGPNSMANQSQWEDGIKVDQNRDLLDAQGIKWMGMDDAHQLPALLKEKWVKRIDQRIVFRRRVTRKYPILNVVSAEVRSLDNEQYLTDIDINPPD